MDPIVVVSTALGAIIGAVALYALQRLPAVRQRLHNSLTRMVASLNSVRKFVFASRRTRISARAARIASRTDVSLRRLRKTLFHWYEEFHELWPYLVQVYDNNENELVTAATAELLWIEKSVGDLQPGDIVRRGHEDYGHVVHVNRTEDGVLVTWQVTHNSTSSGGYSNSVRVKVTRRGWCPVPACRYCQMGTDLSREIGEWWWSREEARRDAMRLRRGGDFFRVQSADDAEAALDGLGDHESIGTMGERALEAPNHLDYEPIVRARTVAELKTLARDGWTFQVTICRDYDHFPPVIVYNWFPPPEHPDEHDS